MGMFRSRRNLFRDYARERRRKCTVCAALAFAVALAATTWFLPDTPGPGRTAQTETLHELDTSAEDMGLVPAA
jgi:hypothetical protein